MDAGSRLYDDTLQKVPVLHPRDHAYVDPSVLEQSLKSMIGLCEEQPSAEVADSAAAPFPADYLQVAASAAVQLGSLKQNVKKRRLYRKASDESVVWIPHDNHPDLLKELVWESSSPRWVLHGTPASGAGIMGCLEAGVSVIALCEDTHHETHLSKTVRGRAVEAMLAGSNVFKDDDLQPPCAGAHAENREEGQAG